MTEHKSVQVAKLDVHPFEPLATQEESGRVRMKFFEFTVPAGDAAIDDTILLCARPANSRMLGGRVAHEAMSTGGANASIRIGVTGDDDKYLGDTNIDAAGATTFGDTIALNFGDLATSDEMIFATVKTEALAATKKLVGYILYVLD